ncbi:hypothetical protein PRABACTJOHN_02951 [Parabacteroides johnsonii DSM 18315]|jgi:hypothetical protein|uniref:Uncharacterized protein n=1 Tax=Parabacteroides johnsonii DSM 18315 TaxID=537006 RepID=B7BD31_9BACT|nr:hypothetical protein [Parabacteroides johnsonii]EEC95666.1 hypothetical protein PRABACTJOHN_02951 [Parabacteroides johnsonii DSM 18315]UEA89124.1 hypothetical protein LK449_11160 [Parabacteroides johnsonii]UWP41285.1 hypothetical protein NQ564_10135 [Parabacteroides johnsonii DSM 18315]HJG99305.1 hypothetical protein [Parabacteroides johnsonii]
MRKQYTYKPVALRFRRWSRKRYAAFVSIQRAVTIGQLSANVSERFQTKNGSVHTSVLTFDKTGEGEAEEKEKTYRSDSSESIPLSRLYLQALCPVLTVSQPAASYAHIVKDNISEIAEGPSYKLKAFRDFRLYKYEIT